MPFFLLFSGLFGKIQQLHVKVSIGEKSMYWSLEFNGWAEVAIKKDVLQKYIFFKIAVLQRTKLVSW